MGRFHYRMQSILDIKMKMETQARQEFAAAKSRLDAQEERLAVLEKRKKNYEREAAALLQGSLNVRDIRDNKEALLKMEEFISAQNQRIDIAKRELDEAREHLTDVMKERKTHETLKEKAFEEFIREENRQESKVVDELTSYTYGQKRQVKH